MTTSPGRLVLVSADDLAQRRARLEMLLGRMRTKRDVNTVMALLALQRMDEAAFDAAPADPAETVRQALPFFMPSNSPFFIGKAADAVLVALGADTPTTKNQRNNP